MRIAVAGLSGLVGSRVKELLLDKHEFVPIGLSAGVDIVNADSVLNAIKQVNPDVVLNLAAKADVDGSEAEKDLGEESEAWKINVVGARNMASACLEVGKRLIHISTDFVFDGEKDFYTEDDVPTTASGWYGQTKLDGEKAIIEADGSFIIARIAYPYRASFGKKDFVRAMCGRLREGLSIKGVVDHVMTPTFIDDIAYALDALFEKGEKGIYHVVGSGSTTPYDAALLICDKFGLDKALVSKTTRAEYFTGKAERPFRLFLKNDKIEKLGTKMRSFEDGLIEVRRQGLENQ